MMADIYILASPSVLGWIALMGLPVVANWVMDFLKSSSDVKKQEAMITHASQSAALSKMADTRSAALVARGARLEAKETTAANQKAIEAAKTDAASRAGQDMFLNLLMQSLGDQSFQPGPSEVPPTPSAPPQAATRQPSAAELARLDTSPTINPYAILDRLGLNDESAGGVA